LYLAHGQSKLVYALGAWWPSASPLARTRLERLHMSAATVISGCVQPTRNGVKLREAGLDDLQRLGWISAATLYERVLRAPGLMRDAGAAAGGRKKRRRTWKTVGRAVLEKFDLLTVKRAEGRTTCPPWTQLQYNVTAIATLVVPTKRTDTPAKRREAAEATLAKLPEAHVTCYTDGSVRDPGRLRDGYGAYVIYDAAGGVREGAVPAGRRATSYHAELQALVAAVAVIRDGMAVPTGAEIRLLTDSQALVRRAEKGLAADLTASEEELVLGMAAVCAKNTAHITLQWVPSHCGLPGNERANELAEKADVEQTAGLGLRVLNQSVRLEVRREWDREEDVKRCGIHKTHVWREATEGGYRGLPADPALRRCGQRLLAQLRGGKSLTLGKSRNAWGLGGEAHCQTCGAEDDVKHLLSCPGTADARKAAFGTATPGLGVLLKRQPQVLQYLEATGRSEKWEPPGAASPGSLPRGRP
jgi:ribonuclease HI